MIYTKSAFGTNLKDRILNRQNIIDIGSCAYEVYLDWPDVDDVDFLNLLIHLNTMELGPEFAFTYEELEKIADDLIAGRNVQL